MFLPSYLAARADSGDAAGDVRVRSAQWIGTMAIIAVLGVFDYVVFCRLLRSAGPALRPVMTGRATGPPERPCSPDPKRPPASDRPFVAHGRPAGPPSLPPKNSGPRGA